MRIAYFLDTQNSPGGAGLLLIKNAFLMKETNQVEIIIPDSDGFISSKYIEICEINGLKYSILPYITFNNIRGIDFYNALHRKDEIVEFLIGRKIEFVHYVQLNLTVEIACRELNIPHLMSAYQLYINEINVYNTSLFSHYHLCDSQFYSKIWIEELKVESRVIRPISPIANNLITEKVYNADNLNITMAGVLCERKNQLCAIKIMERLAEEENITLTILGSDEGEYGKTCKDYIKKRGLQKKVEICGFKASVGEYMLKSDIFLSTSNDESFPSSIVEALSYGNIIVATPVAGIPEVFKDEYNAFISDGYGEEDIYTSIKKAINCIKSKKRIKQLKEHMMCTWEENFSWRINKKKICNYYEDIINSKYVNDIGSYNEEKTILDGYASTIPRVPVGLQNRVRKELLCIGGVLELIKGEDVYIWGAGIVGEYVYTIISLMGKNTNVLGFVDIVKKGKKNNKVIFSPQDLLRQVKKKVILSYSGEKKETIDFLKNANWMNDEIIIFS